MCSEIPGNQAEPTSQDLDELVNLYNSTLAKATESHAPLKTRTMRVRPAVPWYNDEINAAKRKRRKAERMWRKTKLSSDLNVFKSMKNHVIYLMNQARRSFYTNFVAENSTDQRKLFRAAKKLLIKNEELSFPDYQDKLVLANEIGTFFIRKIKRIRADIENITLDPAVRDTVPDDPEVDDSKTLNTFRLLNNVEIYTLIQKSNKKTCSLDPMPTSLVVSCLDELLPVIMYMVNTSLSVGHFPDEWKEALVAPLLKKTGLDTVFKNLRPISNLQFVSKLTERAVFDQIHDHMMRFDLYPLLQSAYRQGYSTETALLKVQNDLLMNMNRQQLTLLVFLDLSAAFDTVDHKILLSRLKSSIGIRGTALDWFASYLSNRSQRIHMNGFHSDCFPLPFGVPQGSCLGPLLFTIYASKLFDVIKQHLPDVHVYADDTQLYISFKPDSVVSQLEAIKAMEQCIRDIRTWMIMDKLRLNDDKTEFMVIGTSQQLAKVDVDHLMIGDTRVARVKTVKNLGTWFDSNLNLRTHINKICSTAYYHLNNIRRIRKFLSKEAAQTLIHAYVIGHIDYCNSLLYGLPAVQLNKLQRLQNSAARLIGHTPRYCHITPVLFSLHWLPVKFRIDFKIFIITFKAIYGLAPQYICDLVTIRKQSNYSLRSNSGLLLYSPNMKTKTTLGDRAFSAAAPRLWNSLPLNIRQEVNFNTFKGLVKTYLFKTAFY